MAGGGRAGILTRVQCPPRPTDPLKQEPQAVVSHQVSVSAGYQTPVLRLSDPFSFLGQGSCHYAAHTDHKLAKEAVQSAKYSPLHRKKPSMVSHAYNPSTGELDTGALLETGRSLRLPGLSI